jgi:hypothetical protein
MNAHTHTSGPWHLGRRAGNPAIYSQDGAEIAEVLRDTNDDWRGNARLIAAAPDLLAALRDCLPIVDAMRRKTGGEGDTAAMNARAAIAKAERGAA